MGTLKIICRVPSNKKSKNHRNKLNEMKINTVTIISISILFLHLSSCQDNNRNQTNKNNFQVVDLASTHNGDTINLSDFLTHKKYISLETKEECLIGHISKLKIYNDRIFILDPYIAKKLLVFDIKGNFLYPVSERGNGPGEYEDIFDFNIHDNKIYILNNRSSIIEFTLDAKYIKTYKLPLWANHFFNVNGEKWGLITNSDKSHGFESNFHLTENDFSNEKGFVNSRYDDFPVSPFKQTCCLNDTNYFFLPFDNSIYFASNKGISLKYKFEFPENCIINDSRIKNYAKLPFRERVDKILNNSIFISSIIFTPRLKLISFSKKRKKFLCFMNEKDHAIIPQKYLRNDVDNITILPTFYSNFNSNKIVACFQPHEIIEEIDKNRRTNSDLEKNLSNSSEVTKNPIIAIYETTTKKEAP